HEFKLKHKKMKTTFKQYISYVRLAVAMLCGALLLFGCSKSNDGPDKETEYRTDVYVAGYEYNGNEYVAKYWVNGQAVDLSDGAREALASAIFVENGDVYVAGYEYNGSTNVAKYWKNGQGINLTNGHNEAEANAIVVVNSDIYVAGYEHNGSKYI